MGAEHRSSGMHKCATGRRCTVNDSTNSTKPWHNVITTAQQHSHGTGPHFSQLQPHVFRPHWPQRGGTGAIFLES